MAEHLEGDAPDGTFQPFLDCIHDLFADGPCAILTEGRDRAVVNLYHSGGDPAGIRSYESHYAGINPWFEPRRIAPAFLRGEVVASEETLPLEEYRRTEFYNDWGLANHVVHGMGTLVHSSPDVMTSILVNRSAGKGEARREEIALLQALVPHLGRAVRLQQHLREMDGLRAFFDHSPWPAFVMTPRVRLLLANAAGERLLRRRDGFCTRGGYLRTTAEGAEGDFRRVVANCEAIGPGDESAWSCRVPRPGPVLWHAVFAHPLPAEAAGPGLGSRILLYAVDPMESRPLAASTLGELFRLPAAEAALVLAGAAHDARVGVDLNLQYGLDDWVAATPDEYRRIAIAKAADPAALAELRSQMRDRLAASALDNPDAFVRHLESAYREMMIGRLPA